MERGDVIDGLIPTLCEAGKKLNVPPEGMLGSCPGLILRDALLAIARKLEEPVRLPGLARTFGAHAYSDTRPVVVSTAANFCIISKAVKEARPMPRKAASTTSSRGLLYDAKENNINV